MDQVRLQQLLPPKDSKKASDIDIRNGILAILKADYEKASKEFNRALRADPRNSYFQFLNGLTYHLMAETGDASQFEQARIGYEQALKLDPDNWLASQQLGQLLLAKEDYVSAQDHFAKASLSQPNDPEILYGLAQASYRAQDLATALPAIKHAKELNPRSAKISGAHALISAAAGRTAEAKVQLADYTRDEPKKSRVARLAESVSRWEDMHDAMASPAAGKGAARDVPAELEAISREVSARKPARTAPAQPKPDGAPAKERDEEKMVVIDVCMIRTEEYQNTAKGLNLLDGLMLHLSGSAVFTETRNPTGAVPVDVSRVLTSRVEMPVVKYNMNIFNSSDDRNEILARPTLIALNGKTSTFFAGNSLDVAITGTQEGTVKNIDVGVTLTVTPTFLPNERVQLDVTASRSFFEDSTSGTFNQSVRSSKNSVTASVAMDMNQTLVLSGLREKQTQEVKSGVPVLRDIPIIQYLFSHERTLDFHKSVVILISPRRPHPGVDISPEPALVQAIRDEPPHLKEYRERFGHMFQKETNIQYVWTNLSQNKVFQELYKPGVFDKRWWGERESLETVLRRTLSFLYY